MATNTEMKLLLPKVTFAVVLKQYCFVCVKNKNAEKCFYFYSLL